MIQFNSIETLNKYLDLKKKMKKNLDEKKFRLNKINKINVYFNSEIRERKIMRKKTE